MVCPYKITGKKAIQAPIIPELELYEGESMAKAVKLPSEKDEDQILKEEIVKIFSNLLPEQQEQAKAYLRYLLDTQEKTSQDNL